MVPLCVSKFGSSLLKVNHHLAACHLEDVILDYGPMCGYWAFPLERFDGKTSDIHTNGTNIEVSIMRKFFQTDRCVNVVMKDKSLLSSITSLFDPLNRKNVSASKTGFILPSDDHYNQLLSVIGYKHLTDDNHVHPASHQKEYAGHYPFVQRKDDYRYVSMLPKLASLSPSDNDQLLIRRYLDDRNFCAPCIPFTKPVVVECAKLNISQGKYPYEHVITALKLYYRYVYQDVRLNTYFEYQLRLFYRMFIYGDQFGSAFSGDGERSSYIRAYRRCIVDSLTQPPTYRYRLSVAWVQYFFEHTVYIDHDVIDNVNNNTVTHPVKRPIPRTNKYAYVEWFEQTHHNAEPDRLGQTDEQAAARIEYQSKYDDLTHSIYVKSHPIELSENESYAHIVPVSHIVQRCMIVPEPIANEGEYLVIPLERKLQG
jgi:hypothetical protein